MRAFFIYSDMENERKFLGVWIPAEVWLDHSISIIERALFAEIHSLDGPRGCFASNEYFAENFGITVATISKSITRLKEAGYIEQESFDGRRRVLRSLLHFEKQPSKKLKADTNDFEGRHQDSLSLHSKDLKHIEKKITKVDNKDYNEGDAPAPFAEVEVLPLNDGNTQDRITGPDAPKKRTSKKSAETMIADVYTREGFITAWEWTPFAKAHPEVDPGTLYDRLEAWSSSKGERKLDWLATGRVWVQRGKPGEFALKVLSIDEQAKIINAQGGRQLTQYEIALEKGKRLFMQGGTDK